MTRIHTCTVAVLLAVMLAVGCEVKPPQRPKPMVDWGSIDYKRVRGEYTDNDASYQEPFGACENEDLANFTCQ